MKDEEKALELSRLGPKLNLWNTPGFSQFIEDLDSLKGNECSIKGDVESLRLIYKRRYEDLIPKSKFVQTKLEI